MTGGPSAAAGKADRSRSRGAAEAGSGPSFRQLAALACALLLLLLALAGCSSGSGGPQAANSAEDGRSSAESSGGAGHGGGWDGAEAGASSGSEQASGSGEEAAPPAKPDAISGEKRIKIGFAMDTLLEERWKKDRDLFVEAAQRLGAEVIVKSADGDDARQIAQAEAMISQGVDVLVIVPHNAEATAAIVSKAHKSGIKVLSYDRLVTNADVDLYVSFDNVEVGHLQAEAIMKIVPKGNYVYIGGADTDNNARQFKEGVFEALQPSIERGDIRIVYDQWSKDWKPVYALENMLEALKANGAGGIDAVIVANDATAGGAVRALERYGLAGSIPVAGQDADLEAVRRIVDGTQTMTVYKPIGRLAEDTARLAVALAKGEPTGATRRVNNGKIEVPSILLSPIAVDASNLDGTVIADGFHSREEVYGKGGE
ncbi:D-xylose ABC transporter substrate-binding protein [Saccharibacillus alkalitolerans]|uniref:D-xylose ABC transporter substrate-binding protein n=1 Tax=Saccharibacillus alkalitolerans TaxID=2705290 RepID=A0ABX0F3G6_9BACL|nr:D-xylose ABC transporter substrate-binding protein [Saccharibacillus alkalitolerans]NGZ75020.1 D-xylose ABC transporter substrate-binding protein [Saccharibacillus alkalitolerans]